MVLIGGTGSIGTAAAAHLLQRVPSRIVLTGRDAERGREAVRLVEAEAQRAGTVQGTVEFQPLSDWRAPGALASLLSSATAVLHFAGPWENEEDPLVLDAAIAAKVPVYVDVADPVPLLRRSMTRDTNETMALVASGAFPGLSNLLAVDLAARLETPVQDVDFNYFTSGLGGSGAVNLLITNLGFGEPVRTFRGGREQERMVGGLEPARVEFYLGDDDPAKSAVGERECWAWPFPEGATVPAYLSAAGSSNVRMGTSPQIWNVIIGILAKLTPRDLWRKRWFSKGMADFSQPMVNLADQFVGETHAMRVDVTGQGGERAIATQSHESFRACVGQSAAEFAMALLRRRDAGGSSWRPGVYTPETLFGGSAENAERVDMIQTLTSTPGTISFRVARSPAELRLQEQ